MKCQVMKHEAAVKYNVAERYVEFGLKVAEAQ